jgi:hypothetical protein
LHAFHAGAVAGATRGGIDTIDYVDGLPGLVFHPKPTIAPHGAPVLVSGWTVDPATNAGPAAVVVLLDATRPLAARTGIARGDIMIEHGVDEFVGFQVVVDTTDLAPGSHELRVFALGGDGLWYESAVAGFRLYHDVISPKGSLERPLRMSLDGRVDLTAGRHVRDAAPIRGNHWLQFQGWTYDVQTKLSAERVAIVDATGRMWSGSSHVYRPDVGAALGSTPALGFEIVVPAAVFPRGRHKLEIIGFTNAGQRYVNAIAVTMDVIAEDHRFPLTARRLAVPAPVGAKLLVIEHSDPDEPEDDIERTVAAFALPAQRLPIPADTEIRIEGWALDARGDAGDDVYLEVGPLWAAVPPQRLPASSGWMAPPFDAPVPGGIAGSYFTASVNAADLRGGAWELAVVVVQPDRCSFARTPIATVTIVAP